MHIPVTAGYQPLRRLTFRFPSRALYGVRVVETAAGAGLRKIAEATLLPAGAAVPPDHLLAGGRERSGGVGAGTGGGGRPLAAVPDRLMRKSVAGIMGI
jgi:hypothetical protein